MATSIDDLDFQQNVSSTTSNNQFIEWKWSTGEEYEKSLRPKYVQYDTAKNAIDQALCDFDPRIPAFSRNIEYVSKREESSSRLSERTPITQIGGNPYLNATSYVNDIMTQETFMKPINTSLGREKYIE